MATTYRYYKPALMLDQEETRQYKDYYKSQITNWLPALYKNCVAEDQKWFIDMNIMQYLPTELLRDISANAIPNQEFYKELSKYQLEWLLPNHIYQILDPDFEHPTLGVPHQYAKLFDQPCRDLMGSKLPEMQEPGMMKYYNIPYGTSLIMGHKSVSYWDANMDECYENLKELAWEFLQKTGPLTTVIKADLSERLAVIEFTKTYDD